MKVIGRARGIQTTARTTRPHRCSPRRQIHARHRGRCGGGRVAGKGPQLMGTTKTDAEIVSRIVNGKTGQMPAFGSAFSGEQLQAIVAYIRGLKAS